MKNKGMMKNENAGTLQPLMIYAVGVPGFLCFVMWVFFFRP